MSAEPAEIPIVCTLQSAEFHEREAAIQKGLMSRVVAVSELETGYAYRLPADDHAFREATEFIDLERRCCPFLDFLLSVPRGSGDITLELTGPPGAKEFISKTFRPANVDHETVPTRS